MKRQVPMDKILTPEEILTYQNFVIPVGGLGINTHDLAKAGWFCRVRRNKYAGRTKLMFMSDDTRKQKGKATISASVMCHLNHFDFPYLLERIEEGIMGHQFMPRGVHEYPDHMLLHELANRAKSSKLFRMRKKRKQKREDGKPTPPTNIVYLQRFIEKFYPPVEEERKVASN